MKFSIPTNWQEDLLEKIDLRKTEELFGKLEYDCVGGAHASCLLPPVRKSTVVRQIAKVHAHGLKFNYLLNAPCLSNIEWTRAGQKNIRVLLDWVSEAGADSVTVAVPYLIQLIKKCYPHFQTNVSIGGAVDTPLRAQYWEDLGADLITLSCVDVNRNFGILKKIRARVRCKLQLIANLPCLPSCHMQRYHGGIASHASREHDVSGNFHIDYCSLTCRFMRLADPEKFISAVWIRPEDVIFYEEIGIDRIKLVDRGMNTETLVRVVNAYTDGRYDGNLMDLFPFSIDRYVVSSKKYFWKKLKYFFHPLKFNLPRFMELNRTLPASPIYLDNRKLDGFLDFFIQGKCPDNDCGRCGYCRSVAEKALVIPAEYREKMLRVYEEMLDELASGELFYIHGKSKDAGSR